jgi:hypothetical protein
MTNMHNTMHEKRDRNIIPKMEPKILCIKKIKDKCFQEFMRVNDLYLQMLKNSAKICKLEPEDDLIKT